MSFALSTNASSWPSIARAETVVVNFLDAEQHALAARFATSGSDRFAAPTRWSRLATGEPILEDVPGHLRGRVHQRHRTGDHHLVVVEVLEASTRHHAPLLYHAGSYTTVAKPEPWLAS